MKRSFFPLFTTNFFGVINDNFLKTLASLVALGWLGDERLHSVFMGCTAAALVLPYILCSPLADRLTVVFPKRRILRLAKWAELPIVTVAILGFMVQSTALVVAAILLMGLQSSLYSPAKYALVRDVGGTERISVGMGGMEGVAFLAVLAGTIVASFAADRPDCSWAWYACLVGFALGGLFFSYTIRAEEELSRSVHAINPLRYFARARRMARRHTGLNAVILTLSVFWFVAAMLQQGLIVYGKDVLGLTGVETGGILALAAVGIVAGQVLAGFVDQRHFLLGASLLTGWIAAALLFVLFLAPLSPVAFAVVTALLAFDLGFFKLPLDAEIQKVVKGPKLNTMLAYFNQVSFLFMFFASVCYIAVSWLFGPRAFLALLALVMAVAPFLFVFSYRSVFLFTGRWVFRRRYRVTLKGFDQALPWAAHPNTQTPVPPPPNPATPNPAPPNSNTQTLKHSNTSHPTPTPLLVLPNHPAMVDPMIVGAEFWRTPLKPLVDESFFRAGIVAPAALRTLGAVAVPDLRKHRTAKGATVARGLSDIVLKTLSDGGNVIFYPAGHIFTDPELEPPKDGAARYAPSGEPREDIGTRQLAYNICRDLPAGVRVIGVRTTGLWGSIWSRKGRRTSPPFVPTFIKSVLLWFFVAPFRPRRPVTLEVEDLTERVRTWSALTRLEFNARLNDWYNGTQATGTR